MTDPVFDEMRRRAEYRRMRRDLIKDTISAVAFLIILGCVTLLLVGLTG